MKKVKLRRRINENIGYMFDIASSQSQTYNPYSYSLIDLNTCLSQKGNSLNNERYVNIGSYIEGYGYNDRKTLHKGIVKNVIKNEYGYIDYLIILDETIHRFVKILPDNIKLLK